MSKTKMHIQPAIKLSAKNAHNLTVKNTTTLRTIIVQCIFTSVPH